MSSSPRQVCAVRGGAGRTSLNLQQRELIDFRIEGHLEETMATAEYQTDTGRDVTLQMEMHARTCVTE